MLGGNEMTKVNKIIAILMSIAILFSTVCGMTIETFAASKPSETSISSLTAKNNGFTVKWKKKSGTGYQIQYSTSSKFKSAKTVKISKASTTSKTVSNLSAKKKYYVRVRVYKKSGKKTVYSKWSKTKKVTTKTAASTTGISVTKCETKPNGFKLTWKPVSNDSNYYRNHNVKYQIQYSTSNKFSNASIKTLKCSEYVYYSSYNVTSNDKGKVLTTATYYVRMRAVIDGKAKSWSKTQKVDVVNYMLDLENYAS